MSTATSTCAESLLNVTATAWALSTKELGWQDEREVRMIFLVREGRIVTQESCVRPNGRMKRYLEVPVTRLPRMPVEEFIIGPNQDIAAATERAVNLLADLKYRNAEARVIPSLVSVPPLRVAYRSSLESVLFSTRECPSSDLV